MVRLCYGSARSVRSGQYSPNPSLLRLEEEARAARRGLWALPEAERTLPWEWRAAERSGQGPGADAGPPAPAASRAPHAAASGFACGTKRYCKEMASCAEARFHLSRCGASGLDSDGDGTPCEALCR